jgi:AraC-like DNA-binding protein
MVTILKLSLFRGLQSLPFRQDGEWVGQMHAPDTSPLHSVPRATGTITRLVIERLRAAGQPLDPLLQRAGLNLEDIDSSGLTVKATAQIKLLQLASELLNDDLLGFHLARDFNLREAGLLYYVLSSSSSFADAIKSVQRYTRIVHEGIEIRSRVDRALIIALNYLNVDRGSDRHQIEFWLVAMVRMCRQLTDTRIAPLELRVRHFRETTPPEFRAFLGCDMVFGTDADEIVLPEHVNSLPIIGADRHLHQLLIRYADDALAERTLPGSDLRPRVERAIAPLLPHGNARASTVARELGLSRHALARSLAASGVTFSDVLDQYRASLAEAYITHHDLSISQIAWLLGYREVNAFTHAFERWFGIAPEQMRTKDRPA